MPDPSFSLADEYYQRQKKITFKGACKLLDCICKCVHEKFSLTIRVLDLESYVHTDQLSLTREKMDDPISISMFRGWKQTSTNVNKVNALIQQTPTD